MCPFGQGPGLLTQRPAHSVYRSGVAGISGGASSSELAELGVSQVVVHEPPIEPLVINRLYVFVVDGVDGGTFVQGELAHLRQGELAHDDEGEADGHGSVGTDPAAVLDEGGQVRRHGAQNVLPDSVTVSAATRSGWRNSRSQPSKKLLVIAAVVAPPMSSAAISLLALALRWLSDTIRSGAS